MEKFRNKYRIQSNRMPGWDYAGKGRYFITLVTQNRECNLGTIKNGKINLSDFGKIIDHEWLKSFKIRKELTCDEYIIMPNHLHAIVVLSEKLSESGSISTVETHGRASLRGDDRSFERGDDRSFERGDDRSFERDDDHSFQRDGNQNIPRKFYRKPKSISSFIAGFKSAINSRIDDFIDDHGLDIPKYNRNNHFFQSNYHDRVIRNDAEYDRIKNYIRDNPKKWDDDQLNQEN